MNNIGAKIKSEREAKGLLQKDLAQVLGLKASTVACYETNHIRPSYEVLIALADYFEVTTDYLLGRED